MSGLFLFSLMSDVSFLFVEAEGTEEEEFEGTKAVEDELGSNFFDNIESFFIKLNDMFLEFKLVSLDFLELIITLDGDPDVAVGTPDLAVSGPDFGEANKLFRFFNTDEVSCFFP